MKFNKYSESKDSVTIGSFASLNTNTNNSSSSTNTPTRGGVSSAGDRILWGQLDDGGDLDNSMMVKGNIYIKPSVGYDENGEDGDKDIDGTDKDFNYDWDEDTDGGSLYVEKNITSGTVNSNEVYGKTVFVNYPTSTGNKTNIVDLTKRFDERITTNTNNISTLTSKVNTNTNNISTLTSKVDTNTNNISTLTSKVDTNTTNISSLSTKLNNISTIVNSNTIKVQQHETKLSQLETRVNNIKECTCQGAQGGISVNNSTVIDDNVEWKYMSLNNNSQSGFIFKSDDDAVVEFSSKQLGEEIEVEEGGIMTPFAHYSDIITCKWDYMHNASSPEEYEGGYFKGGGKIQDIGYFNVGEYITIYTILGNLKSYTDNDYNCALTQTSYTLYRDGVLTAVGNGVALTYNVKIAGNYSFKLSVWGTHDKPEALIKETDKSVCIVNCDYQIQKSSTTGHISPNGISYSFNNNNSMVFFGSECAVLKYGNYGLKISSNGIYRFNGSDWVLTSL